MRSLLHALFSICTVTWFFVLTSLFACATFLWLLFLSFFWMLLDMPTKRKWTDEWKKCVVKIKLPSIVWWRKPKAPHRYRHCAWFRLFTSPRDDVLLLRLRSWWVVCTHFRSWSAAFYFCCPTVCLISIWSFIRLFSFFLCTGTGAVRKRACSPHSGSTRRSTTTGEGGAPEGSTGKLWILLIM